MTLRLTPRQPRPASLVPGALAGLLCCVAALGSVAAEPVLRPFPPAVLAGYAATLRRGQMAVVETEADGRPGQITLLGYSAAPPAVVRALVADPALYPRYTRNLTRSEVERRPDGALVHRWRLSYPIGSFEGQDEVRALPPAAPGAVGAVEIRSLGAGQHGRFRWDFLPAPGGGTVIVDAGLYDPLDNRFLRAMIGADPALDVGFNLAGGLSLLRALLAEADRGVPVPPAAPQAEADLQPLLDRGTLAIVRTTPDGQLVDVSVAARVAQPAAPLLALVRTPETWPRFLRSIRRVTVTERGADALACHLVVSGVIFDVETDLRVRFVPGGADNLGVGGALRGARFRWDLRDEGPGRSVVVWRGNVHLGDTSRLVRAMFRIEPSFEHSANVSLGLLAVRGLLAEAAQLGARSP